MTLDDTFLTVGSKPPECSADAVRIGAFERRSTVLGPGQRAVVWVAGCLRRCPGCIKPEFLSFDSGRSVTVSELARNILEIPDLQGVTFTGGEPFEQAHALGALGRLVKASGLDIAVYSGYRLVALQAELERFGPLLDMTDYLVDGEYRQEFLGPFRWRGSSNQTIYRRIGQDFCETDFTVKTQEVQLSVDDDRMRLIGFPDQSLIAALSKSLARRGIELKRPRGA